MADVQDQVLNALHWDLALPRNGVAVTVQEGVVTLSGQVERPYQKSCAEADVLRVPGVVAVRNQIIVCDEKADFRH